MPKWKKNKDVHAQILEKITPCDALLVIKHLLTEKKEIANLTYMDYADNGNPLGELYLREIVDAALDNIALQPALFSHEPARETQAGML